MNFGQAIEALKEGKKVTRKGWNGKKMFLWLKQAAQLKSDFLHDPILKQVVEENGGAMDALGTICMKTADNKVLTGWLASQTDMLSEDWEIVGSYDAAPKKECHDHNDGNAEDDHDKVFTKAVDSLKDWSSRDTETRSFILITGEKREDDFKAYCAVVGQKANNIKAFIAAKNEKESPLGEIVKRSSFVEFMETLAKI